VVGKVARIPEKISGDLMRRRRNCRLFHCIRGEEKGVVQNLMKSILLECNGIRSEIA
jgi:hypothetical protein